MDSLTSIWPPATTKNAGGFAGVCRRLQEFAGFAGFSGGFRRFTGFQEVWHACFQKPTKSRLGSFATTSKNFKSQVDRILETAKITINQTSPKKA